MCPPLQTIGASFAMKKVEANGRTCNLGIWVRRASRSFACRGTPAPPPHPLRPPARRPCSQDTAGQERFDSLSSFYCRGARAAIICFDLTDR